MTKQDRALQHAVKKIGEWKYKNFIKKVILYGSFARGDYTNASDIDIYLECDEGIPVNAMRKFRAEIIPSEGDAAEVDLHYGFKELHESDGLYYRNIEREGKILWGNQPLIT